MSKLRSWQKEYEDLKKDKKKAFHKGDLKLLDDINCQIGHLLQNNERCSDAADVFEENIDICQANHDNHGVALCHRNIVDCLLQVGDCDKAMEHVNIYLALAKSNIEEEQRAWVTLARVLIAQIANFPVNDAKEDKIERAKLALTKSLELCEELKPTKTSKEYDEIRIRSYLNQAMVFGMQKSYLEAATVVKNALLLSKKHNLQNDTFRCLLNASSLMQEWGKLGKSMVYIREALHIAKIMHSKYSEVECYETKSKIYIKQECYKKAVSCLKKAYKLESKIGGDTRINELKQFLKRVAVISNNYKNIKNTLGTCQMDLKTKVNAFEKLGDTLADMEEYQLALKYYIKQYNLANRLKFESDKIASVCVSIAETNKDLALYSGAIEWYEKELELRGRENANQAADTYYNIGQCQELIGESPVCVINTYRKAIEFARNAEKHILCATILEKLLKVGKCAKDIDCAPEQALYDSIMQDGVTLGGSEENDGENADVLSSNDEFDIDDFSDCSSDSSYGIAENGSQHEGTKCLRSKVRAKKYVLKRNHNGESELHLAAISNKLKKVKQLVANGHPVNVRDNSGWLPIHEAANWGHTDIVTFLAESGAWIDDAGGAECKGLTPLLDSATNGQLAIVQILIDRGANIFHKDAHGRNIIDCLRYANENVHRTDEDEWRIMYGELYDDISERYKAHGMSIAPTAVTVDSDSDSRHSGDSLIAVSSGDDSDMDKKGKATAMYRNALQSVGSAKSMEKHRSPKKVTRKRRKKAGAALVTEDKFEAAGNWLIDDLRKEQQKKRLCADVNQVFRRPQVNRVSSSVSRRKSHATIANDDSDMDEHSTSCGGDIGDMELFGTSVNSTRYPETGSHSPTMDGGIDADRIEVDSVVATNKPLDDYVDIAENWVDDLISDACGPNVGSDTFYIRLNFGDATPPIRTSVPMGHTMDWLCRHAASEYCRLRHVSEVPKPIVTLTVRDGSTFPGTELVRTILACNEELFVSLAGFEDILPVEVYRKICEQNHRPMNKKIQEQLEGVLNGRSISLCGCYTSGPDMSALLDALKIATNTESIILPKNKLLDKHMSRLETVCARMTELRIINLSQNFFTALSDSLVANVRNLTNLDLSGNGLNDKAASLAQVFLLPRLQVLNLDSCGLAGDFLQHLPSEANTNIEYLSLEYNQLLADNAQLLFTLLLTAPRLEELRLKECFHAADRTTCFSHMSQYVTNGLCKLRRLTLGVLNADDLSVQHTCRSLIKNRTIVSLYADPGNTKALLALLAAMSQVNSGVQQVQLVMHHLCKIECAMWDSVIALVTKCCEKKMPVTSLEICNISLDKHLLDTLREYWYEHWQHNDPIVQCEQNNVIFKVNQPI